MNSVEELASGVRAGHLEFREIAAKLKAASANLERCAAYHHPNGFLAFDLSTNGDPVRLHYWSECVEEAQPGFSIHDHVYDFRSLVLFGTVTQTRYEVFDDEDGNFVRYRGIYNGNTSILECIGEPVGANAIRVETIERGAVYDLAAGEFHSVTVTNIPTCTLFVKRPSSTPTSPTVLGPTNGPATMQSNRRPLDTQVQQEVIRQLLSHL